MQNKTIPQLLAELAKVRSERAAVGLQYGQLRDKEGELKTAVEQALRGVGLKSAKTEDGLFSASIVTKPLIRVSDEKQVVAWLKKNQPDDWDTYYVGLKLAPFKTLAESMLKHTGEMVPGTEMTESEYINFRENKPKETEKNG